MWINIIFILIVFIFAFVGFSGYSLAKDNTKDSAFDQLSRMELNNKLDKLPESPANIDERPVSAMCYDTAAPLDRVQYICPVCGEMTLYPSYSSSSFAVEHVSYYRNLIKKITKIDVKLDESQLCEKCMPNAESRNLCLIVKLKHDKHAQAHKACGITENDINLLYDYSEGIKEHSDYYGNKVPIANYKQRLEELLGISIIDINSF